MPRTNEEISAQTRSALLAAAVTLFSSQGYQQTSLQEIADAAGVTKGAIYYHFGTKEEVLRRVHDEMIEEIIAASRPVVDADLPPAEALRELIRVHLHAVETLGDAIAVFLRDRRSLGPENWEAIKARRDEVEQMFVGVIARGQQLGAFPPKADARLLAFGVLGMISWATEWYRPGKVPAAEIADMYADMVLLGLTRDDVPATARRRPRRRLPAEIS